MVGVECLCQVLPTGEWLLDVNTHFVLVHLFRIEAKCEKVSLYPAEWHFLYVSRDSERPRIVCVRVQLVLHSWFQLTVHSWFQCVMFGPYSLTGFEIIHTYLGLSCHWHLKYFHSRTSEMPLVLSIAMCLVQTRNVSQNSSEWFELQNVSIVIHMPLVLPAIRVRK